MRSIFTLSLLAIMASLLFVTGAAEAQTTPSYMLIDFNDGVPSNAFLFEYDFTGVATETKQIGALTANAPGFTSSIGSDPTYGGYLISLGYGGHSEYNDFDHPNNPLNQPGYWGNFVSSDGIHWNYSNFGVDEQQISAGMGSLYNAWVWEPQVNGSYSNFTPSALPNKISFDYNVAGASAPEPGSLGLLLLGGLAPVGIFRRRRQIRP